MRDLSLDLDVVQTVVAETHAAVVKGTAVDLADAQGALVIIMSGSDPDSACAIEHSDTTTDGDFAAVSASDLIGTFDSSPTASTTQSVSYIGSKRYLRVKTGDAACGLAACIVKGHLRHAGGNAA